MFWIKKLWGWFEAFVLGPDPQDEPLLPLYYIHNRPPPSPPPPPSYSERPPSPFPPPPYTP